MHMILRALSVSAVALTVLLPAATRAGNISVSEFDAMQSGRAYAASALSNSASVVFYNVGNISRMDGLQLNLGAAAFMPKWKWESLDGTKSESTETTVAPPPSFSLTYKVASGSLGDLGVGFGLYAPYGTEFKWPAEWEGRQDVQHITLRVYEARPALSWKPMEKVSLGAGLRVLYGEVYLKQAVAFGDQQEGFAEMGGDGVAYGAVAGVTVLPVDGLAVALNWMAPSTMKMTGTSHFEFPAPFDTEARDRDVETKLKLAQLIRLGLAYDVIPKKLNISADAEYQLWSTYKELTVSFINADGTRDDQSQRRDAKNSWLLSVGGEYWVNDAFAVRAGYAYDQKVLPEDTVNPAPPNSDQHIVAVGASYVFGRYGVHANLENVFFAPREARTNEFPGKFSGGWAGSTVAYIFGLSFSAAFDVGPLVGEAPHKGCACKHGASDVPTAVEPAPEVVPAVEPAPAVESAPAPATEAAPGQQS